MIDSVFLAMIAKVAIRLDAENKQKITSVELFKSYLDMPFSNLNVRQLRKALPRFGWKPRKLRLGNKTLNGYVKSHSDTMSVFPQEVNCKFCKAIRRLGHDRCLDHESLYRRQLKKLTVYVQCQTLMEDVSNEISNQRHSHIWRLAEISGGTDR